MKVLTTGLINNTPVAGIRPSTTICARYRNKDLIPAVVQIRGYYLQNEAKIEYVVDSFTLKPGKVLDTNHYAQFDAFEFRFLVDSEDVEIKAWGKNSLGNMTVVYSLHSNTGFSMGELSEEGRELVENRNYVNHPERNSISVFDKKTQALITTIAVGLNPQGIGVNPITNRIYVANQGSNNVTVIDGNTFAVIATILVGVSPKEVRVDYQNNKIYVSNEGSNSHSVINGTTHTVVATIYR